MLYTFVRPIATAALKVFFRHIYISGFDKIPSSGPVLIPSNHPTAFIEPCLAACFQHRTLNFIVRGDIFKKPFYIKLLRSLHLIPIFRFKDGYANLKNNQETFKYCNEVLRDQKAIFILVEGRTIQEKRLRTLQKGTARMAFGAYEEFGIDNTVIVPMGVSYENANTWRHDVIMACTDPIYLKDYIDLYKENPNQAIQQLTDDIASVLPDKMVIIPDKEDDEISELLCLIWKNDNHAPTWPIIANGDQRLIKEQEICRDFSKLDSVSKAEIKKTAYDYINQLKQLMLKDEVVSPHYKFSISNHLILIVGIVAFIPGFLLNALPVYIAQRICRKKVYVKEFYAPVLFASSTFLLLIWYILLLIAGLIWFGWISIPIIIVLLISGYFSILFLEVFNKILCRSRFNNLSLQTRSEITHLRKELEKEIG